MTEMHKYIIHAILTLVMVLIGMIIVRQTEPPRIVKIDLVAITSHYTQLMAKDTLDGGTHAKQISEIIKTNLEPIIHNYAIAHKAIVIQAQALVDGNVVDISNVVINELDKKIK